jgi:predicted DCC family thiol-disulfide oxidoreductase YuxK
MTKTPALKVFYDGECPLCQREIAYYQRLTSTEPINWIDANENPSQLKAAGITKAEALARLHAVSTKGEIVSGVHAFHEIWKSLPRFRLLAICLNFYPLQLLMGHLYEKFLHYRPTLQKILQK